MLTILAPAKLNLTLEVLGERQDGFHQIRSVIQTINLCDGLSLQMSDNIEFKCDLSGWAAEQSLVSKVATLLQDTFKVPKGVTVIINKGIPLLAGLGGDSSDAASLLLGLNQLWGLGLAREELSKLGCQLSSDLAFFLYGGTALAEGRGETITPLAALAHNWVVLAVPHIARHQGKTKELYSKLKATHFTDGHLTQKLMAELERGEFTSRLLFNTFEDVAYSYFPGLKALKEQMLEAGARYVHLAGSGPTLFTLLKSKAQAEALYRHLLEQRLECYLTETLNKKGI